MRYLITGANGFIGTSLTKKIIAEGGTVRCLVRSEASCRFLQDLGAECCLGSLYDYDSLVRALADVDYVFNLAGQTRALKNSDYFRANCEGAENLLRAAQATCPNLKRFLQISSLAAVGPSIDNEPLHEDCQPHPVTPYGKSKLAIEQVARKYMNSLPMTIVRPPVVYGPRDKSGLAIFKSVAKGINLSIKGGNPQLMPIFVEDLVNGCYLLAHHPQGVGETFFVCGDEITTPNDLFNLLSDKVVPQTKSVKNIAIPRWLAYVAVYVLEARAQLIRKPNRLNSAKLTEIRYPSWLASNTKAKALGFAPQTSLSDGMTITYNWYRENNWL